MKKKFIVSRIEASQDGSPYVYVGFTDPSLLAKKGYKNNLRVRSVPKHLLSLHQRT